MNNKSDFVLHLIKKNKIIIIILFGSIFLGLFLFFLQRKLLIIQSVSSWGKKTDFLNTSKQIVERKNVKLFYWKDGNLNSEMSTFILLSDKSENIKVLLGSWLLFLYEERILDKIVRLDSVSLSISGQEAYLSFNQPIFGKEWSIHKKWKLIDGILRTLMSSGLEIQSVVFLVKHEQMSDKHLDFSQPWSVTNYA